MQHDQNAPLDEEPIPGKTYLADGWMYRNVPWTSLENWNALFEIVGQENVVFLAVSELNGKKRGQVLVSPQGMANVEAYQKSQPN